MAELSISSALGKRKVVSTDAAGMLLAEGLIPTPGAIKLDMLEVIKLFVVNVPVFIKEDMGLLIEDITELMGVDIIWFIRRGLFSDNSEDVIFVGFATLFGNVDVISFLIELAIVDRMRRCTGLLAIDIMLETGIPVPNATVPASVRADVDDPELVCNRGCALPTIHLFLW